MQPPSQSNQAGGDAPGGLGQRSLVALKWSYLGVAVRVILQLSAQILLARLLGPDALGVVAAATLVMIAASLVGELGLGAALVQAPEYSVAQVKAVFARVVLSALAVACGLYVLSGAIAAWLGSADIQPVLQGLLPAFFLQALGVVSLAHLKREMDFRTIQIAQVSGYFLGFIVVGITLAVAGAGVWSLVAAWTVQNLITSLLLYRNVRHGIGFDLRGDLGTMHRFGIRVVLTNGVNWVIENVDNLVVARAFGTTVLGGYTVAYSFVRTPTNHIVNSIQQVMFPASARASRDSRAPATAYLGAVWVVSLIMVPVFAGVAAVSDTLVAALYGSTWLSAAPLLVPLALAMPLHAVMALGGPLLWGRGEVGRELHIQFWIALILLSTTAMAARWSPLAVAWAVFAVYLIRACWIQSCVARVLELRSARLLQAVLPALGVGALVSGALALCDHVLDGMAVPAIGRLLMDIPFAALVLLAVLYAAASRILPTELATVVPRVVARMPGVISIPLGRRLAATASGGDSCV